MGVFKKPDSKFYWLYLRKDLPKERLDVRTDAPTATQRRDNEKLAADIFHQRMAQLARGEAGLAPTTKPTISFRTYALWYLEHHTAPKRSAARERSVIHQWIDLLDTELLHTIDRTRLVEAQTDRLQSVVASTVNRELDIIKRMFAEAVPKYLTHSPIAGMKRLRTTKVGIRLLSRDEEKRLLAVADPTTRALILLGLDTILRLNDARTLRREHVHGLRLQVIDPKVAPYWVDLSHRLRAALDALPEERGNPFYFPRRWSSRVPKPIAPNTVHRLFMAAGAAAGLPMGRAVGGLTFHCLRHTGTTRALQGGHNPKVVQEMGGWQSLRQLERYGHAEDHERRGATNTISGETVTAFPQRSRA